MPRKKFLKAHVFWIASLFFLSGCAGTIPSEALQWSPETVKFRQLQTRKFETLDEAKLLQAAAGVLQDLGFNIDESETRLGVLVASKKRDAKEAGQIVGSALLFLVTCFGALYCAPMPVDETQKIRASIVTRPTDDQGQNTALRVTFQRVVWNTENEVSKTEPLDEPEAYQEFFNKLSKSIFLEAHEI